MGADPGAQTHRLGVAAHDGVGTLTRQSAAPLVQEHRLGVAPPPPPVGLQTPSAVGREPRVEGDPGEGSKRHQPLLGSLAVEPHEPSPGGQVGLVEPYHLGDAGPGAVEQLEQGPVSTGRRVVADHGAQ